MKTQLHLSGKIFFIMKHGMHRIDQSPSTQLWNFFGVSIRRFPTNRFSLALVGVLLIADSSWADAPALKVPRVAEPCALAEVRLLDGPFRDAMVRDQKYLLGLVPDRFLFNFRRNVGLPSSAKPYDGWDAADCEQRGAMLGHYLVACSQMYASTGEAEFKRRVDYIVGELALCQSNSVSAGFHEGYLSAYPESFIDRVEQSQPVWAPWYALHKIMAGLLAANQLCGNEQALVVAGRMADWVKFRVDRLPIQQMQKSLGNEHGGMNEALANLYAVTGNTNYLQLSQAFNHAKVLDPLSRGDDKLNGLHANTQIPKLVGVTREYELTGQQKYLTMADTFWDAVALRRSYVIGGDSDSEHFFPTTDFAKHLSTTTAETCNTYNMLRLTRELFELKPDAAKMDFYERGLYNHILASQDPETGMFVYFMSLRPGHFKTYSEPEDSFWCCVGTGMENHSKYGDTIYFHDANSLYVNLFIASELSWPGKGLVVRQETKYPEKEFTVLKIKAEKPVNFTLKIRHPAWASSGMSVSINGKKQSAASAPGSYFTLSREFHDGDKIEIHFPMTLHTEPLPGVTNEVAILYGPIVLAGELGTNGMPNPFARDPANYSKLPVPNAPMLATTAAELIKQVKPVSGRPLTFRTQHIGRPDDVTLVPFYELHRQRYSVYWKLISEADWQVQKAQFAAEEAQRMAEESRVVDVVQIGEEQSEIDHKMQAVDSQTGDLFARKWRHTGASLSYEVKVLPNDPQQLVATFWGGEVGDRTFDVLVDGKLVATQVLDSNRPGEFFDAVYWLPINLTQKKERVTVKFVPHPGNLAGGFYGLRVLRANN